MFYFGLISSLQAQSSNPKHDLDIDLTQFCRDQDGLDERMAEKRLCEAKEGESQIIDLSNEIKMMVPAMLGKSKLEGTPKESCKTLMDLASQNPKPIEMNLDDDQGNKWKIRFHFGFTRTDYHPTDINIKSGVITTVIQDVKMHERTSDSYYNPTKWEKPENSLQWIDEPSNTMTVSIEKNKNVFYLTAYHPKYLKSLVYSKSENEGEPEYKFGPIEETMDFSAPIPAKQNMLYLGNTHRNMVWQVGYGRQFVIFENKRAGKLSYTVRGDVGINTGKARSVHIIPGVAWDDYKGKNEIQGVNGSIGHRVEYQRGKVSLFIDQKYIHSKIEHGFYDGTVSYDLNSTATTFGVGIDLYSKKSKKVKPAPQKE